MPQVRHLSALSFRSLPSSQRGFSLLEAIVTIGIVGIVVVINVMMLGSIFGDRNKAAHKHEFDSNLESVIRQLDSAAACEGIFASFGPNFKIEQLNTPRDITQVVLATVSPPGIPSRPPTMPVYPPPTIPLAFPPPTIPSGATPIVEVNRDEFNQTLRITKMTVKIDPAQAYQPLPAPANQYPPFAYVWLDLEYQYRRDGVILGGRTRRVLYEVEVTPFDAAGANGGEFRPGACWDYERKQHVQAMKQMCFLMGMQPRQNGTCDLRESEDIRATACRLTGFKYGGKYCDTSAQADPF